ncbi:hypothetical protein ACEWY4_005816 [Coilia grayii]|uniref:Uncharacterized protein n=1 Tax=Coilia grayii TaxID=363190 RepID=A0ABD1KK10_9TELE
MKWVIVAIVAAASLAVVSCASLSPEDLEFHTWKLKFGKVYSTPEEEAWRKDIWLSTRRRVLAHNILADQGIKTYHMGMNQFSDMDREQYHVLLGDLTPSNVTLSPPERSEMALRHKLSAKLSVSVDWRLTGCALESHTCITYGWLPSLSEQQLVDCTWQYGNKGCNGGYKARAFEYVKDNGGIDTEASYPYEAEVSMKWLIVAVASLAVVNCASISLEDLEFQAWKLKFEKSYSSFEEEVQRKLVWLSARRRVLAHNIQADQGLQSYRMGMNQFSDMNNQEYQQAILLSNFNHSNAANASPQKAAFFSQQQGGAVLPTTVDWRLKGCVQRVKDQHQCGSCWAFAAIAVLESHTCIEHGYLPSLSEQQLLDCSRAYGNHGCHGGWETAAFEYVRDNGGIDTDEAYPYEAKDAYCRFKPSGVGALCHGHVELPFGDEDALKETVAFVGPVAVAIDAGRSSFQHYVSGVYNDPHCSKTVTNHVVLVVGYGTEDGQEYWLVKNRSPPCSLPVPHSHHQMKEALNSPANHQCPNHQLTIQLKLNSNQ